MRTHCISCRRIGQIASIVLCVLSLCRDVKAQSPDLHYLDELLRDGAPASLYAQALDSIRAMYIDRKQYEVIALLDPYVERMAEIPDAGDSLLRNAYWRHATAYRKYTTDIHQKEKYLLLAHQYYNPQDSKMSTSTENSLGVTYHQKGDLEKAVYYYLLDLKYQEVSQSKRLGRRYSNIAGVYASMGDYVRAAYYYDKGIDLSLEQQEVYNELFSRANKANALTEVDSIEIVAREIAIIEAKKGAIRNATEKAEIEDMLLDLKSYLAHQNGHFEDAADLLKQKFHYFDIQYPTRFRREYAKLCNEVARQYVWASQPDSARKYINLGFYYLTKTTGHHTLPIDALYPENTFMELFETLSELHITQFEKTSQKLCLDSALLALQNSLYLNHRLENEITLEDSRLESIEYTRVLVEKLVEVYDLMQQHGVDVTRKDIVSVFEMSKGLYLSRLMTHRRQRQTLAREDSLQYLANRTTISDLSKSSVKNADVLRTILILQEQNDSLLASSGLMEQPDPGRTTPFIDYIVGESHVFALDNFSSDVRFTRLGPVDSVVTYVRIFLQQNHARADVGVILHTLFRELLAHAEPLPGQFHIYPDDVLSLLPFDAMIDHQGHYLVENHVIAVKLSSNAEPVRPWPAHPHILCAAPVYGEMNDAIAYERGHVGPLAFAQKEIAAILEKQDSAVVMDPLDMDVLHLHAPKANVFHFAGHARSGPEKGYLILEQTDDGLNNRITGEEIASVPWDLDLAVLSACETGLGEIRKGEGTLSLARAFHEGGTRNVVSTLWKVNDVSSFRVISEFYNRIGQTHSSAEALQEAKKSYLRNVSGQARHPYYWAGYVVSTTEALPDDDGWGWWRWGIAGLMLLIGILLIFKRYTR